MIAKIIRFLAPLFGIGVAKVALGAGRLARHERLWNLQKPPLSRFLQWNQGLVKKPGAKDAPMLF